MPGPKSSQGARVLRSLVDVGDRYAHVYSTGEGTPVVLLHATARSGRMFLAPMTRLADVGEFHAPDLPGSGYSDPLDEMSFPAMTDWLRKVIDGLSEQPVVLGGVAAIGCFLATEMAVRHPDRVSRLVIQNTPFYADLQDAEARQGIARADYQVDQMGYPVPRTLEDVLRVGRLHAPIHPSEEWLDRENTDLLNAGRRFWDYIPMTAHFDLTARLAEVQQEVQFIWGEQFYYATRRDELAAAARRSTVAVVPRAGLFPELDEPEAYDAIWRGTLAK